MAGPNPYAPPANDDAIPEASVTPEGHRSSAALALSLKVALGVMALARIGVGVLTWDQIDLLGRMRDGGVWSMPEAEASDARLASASALALIVLVCAAVLWCMWQTRTSKNARARGAEFMEFGPHAWGWFFCPVINLWRPLQVVSELWRASAPRSTNTQPPTVFGVWWGAWIVGNIVAQISARMVRAESEDIDILISASWMNLGSGVIVVIAAVAAIQVIGAVEARGREGADAQGS